MKVYVVLGGYHYEGSVILAIFHSKEDADSYVEEQRETERYDYYDVDDWEVK